MHAGDPGTAGARPAEMATPHDGVSPDEDGRPRTGRTAEFSRVAAARGAELRRSAAARSQELKQTAASKRTELARTMRDLDVPWARCPTARAAREAILQLGLGPLIDSYTRMRVHGREQFETLPPPVVLVANHSSHLDTPTILRALPHRWRQRTAVAAAADYFYKKRVVASAVALVFNTVPLLRRGGGGLDNGAFDHVDRLLAQRWNLVMYPEGTRSREGRLGRLRSGAAVIAAGHNIPIVPVRLEGTYAAMPPGRNWPRRLKGRLMPRRHEITVHFGAPIWPRDGEPSDETMRRVRTFLEGAEPVAAGAGQARRAAEPAGVA